MRNLICLTALVLSGIVVLTSCEKENTNIKDKNLIPIKITYYGEIHSGEEIYTYDDNNRLIKRSQYSDSTVMEYDNDGKLIKTILYNESSLWYSFTYDYNSLNQMIKIKVYTDHDSEWGWTDLKYDDNGNIKERTIYGYDNLVNFHYTYTYDNNDNMIGENYYEVDRLGVIPEIPFKAWTYSYDDKNHIFKHVNLPFFVETKVNNVVQEYLTVYEEYSGEYYNENYNLSYTYNKDNYPIECVDHRLDKKFTVQYKEIK